MSCTLFTVNNAIVRRVNFNLFVPLFDFSREYLNREVDNRMNTNSSLLIEDYPLLVSPTLAKEIGLSDAIVYNRFTFGLVNEGISKKVVIGCITLTKVGRNSFRFGAYQRLNVH